MRQFKCRFRFRMRVLVINKLEITKNDALNTMIEVEFNLGS